MEGKKNTHWILDLGHSRTMDLSQQPYIVLPTQEKDDEN